MKVIAAIEADFEHGALGTRSRLRDELLGEMVLRRTLRRVLDARRVASVHLVVETRFEGLAREAAAGLAVRIDTHAAGAVPWRSHVASARKWALDGWRGGIGETTVWDESLHPWVLAALAQREGADAVAAVPAGAVLIDPGLLDDMIAHYEKVQQEVRMVFTQSPPGLSAVIYATAMLADLAATVQPPGRAMAYRPSDPQRDMVMLPCYYAVDAAVAQGVGRCIADTDTATGRIEGILNAGGAGSLMEVARMLRTKKDPDTFFPGEVEIELTTEDSLPGTTLRPRGEAVGRRGPMDEALFGRLIDKLAGRDDIRVVLGGFGDPLLHPRWADLVARCRKAGIFGLAVRTPAVTLDEQAVAVLVEQRVDVLNVLLDAATAESYARLHQADCFDRVKANLERVFAAHQASRQPLPLVVCEMMKTRDTMDEMEAFYDEWINKVGTAVLTGPSSYAGQWRDLAVMRMAPPTRFACERIFTRAMVLADGRVTACDQDFRGEHAVGSLAEQSLGEIWRGGAMRKIRQGHLAGAYDGMLLCPRCEEWHRP